MMKVVYDISTLGIGHYYPRARTGVYRVVENIAGALLESEECELSFSAAESLSSLVYSLDYLHATPRFHDVPFIPSGPPSLRRKMDTTGARSLRHFVKGSPEETSTPAAERLKPPLAATVKLEAVLSLLEQKGLLSRSARLMLNPLEEKALRGRDIFHSPFHPLPAQVARLPGIQKFLTVYDLIPILFPQFFEFKENSLVKQALMGLWRDDWALCISQSTKDDLCNYLPRLDEERVVVTPLAASELFYPCLDEERKTAVREKYSIPNQPYLLSLSTLEPRKNIAHAVRCFARVVHEQNLPDLHLVLVGTKGWDYEQIFASIADVQDMKSRIIATGYAADEDLAALYSGALAFVYPSFYEGFGLPPLEAMQCGVPVITSNTSSLPEVVGNAGMMVDPGDEDALCEAMWTVCRDDELRRTMAAKSLERAALFSWRKTIGLTLDAYRTSLKV